MSYSASLYKTAVSIESGDFGIAGSQWCSEGEWHPDHNVTPPLLINGFACVDGGFSSPTYLTGKTSGGALLLHRLCLDIAATYTGLVNIMAQMALGMEKGVSPKVSSESSEHGSTLILQSAYYSQRNIPKCHLA
ncbi:hypothetical protein AVEN_50343-1 [Araneus ventricosus]|uniref:Uncharacterized protein n=1 Tax=Araneus ventricosus TaxID=182803 RepID=A0A4Y2E7A1_ARAVE|nr:hypothetical protein AVEN_50343-1 [Araneus ventricosus]